MAGLPHSAGQSVYEQMSAEVAALSSQILAQESDGFSLKVKQIQMSGEKDANRSTSPSLVLFDKELTRLGVTPFTRYAQAMWHTKKGEFFADVYTMLLNEPHILRYISPDLFTWFHNGSYRIAPH